MSQVLKNDRSLQGSHFTVAEVIKTSPHPTLLWFSFPSVLRSFFLRYFSSVFIVSSFPYHLFGYRVN
ncbi:hypothetical protein ACFX13_031789 [Malus domestica]